MRIIKCHLCGLEIEVNSNNKYCPDCKKKKKKEWAGKTEPLKPFFVERFYK